LAQEYIANEIETMEIYYNKSVTQVENIPETAVFGTI
jgi:hypothetical protein